MKELKIQLENDIKKFTDIELQEDYKYYKEKENRLGKKEKLYLLCLTNEINKRGNVCPSCKLKYVGYPAISRKDNKTEICPECGQKEALSEWIAYKMEEQNGK